MVRPRSPWGWILQLGASLTATTALTGAIALVGGSVWLGARLIVDPQAAAWVNQWLPSWTWLSPDDADTIQTLNEIRTSLARDQYLAGDPISLDASPAQLIPVLAQHGTCAPEDTTCYQVVQLRIYQPVEEPVMGDRPPRFRRVSTLDVTGVEESVVLSPWSGSEVARSGNNRILPLASVDVMDGNPPEFGQWINLSGQYVGNQVSSLYGKIVHYNPDRQHLSLMVQWHSPQRQFPHWKDITGDGAPELIIDHSLDPDPAFEIYRVQPRKFLPTPIQLQPILLNEPALDRPDYRDAITLARVGLWSMAANRLKALDVALNDRPAERSNQELINLRIQRAAVDYHALVAQAYADAPQRSLGDRLQAYLLDGRWQQAIDQFEDVGDRTAVAKLLKGDRGTIARRLETYHRLDPDRASVKIWLAMLKTAQQGRPAAIAWYRQQPGNDPNLDRYLDRLLSELDQALETNRS